jgi:hypothetical protein
VTASVVAPAPPPAADICTIAPNSALCQVLSPPGAPLTNTPVQLATNTVVQSINMIAPPSYVAQPGLHQSTTASDTTGSGATQPGDDKSAVKDKDQAVRATEKGAAAKGATKMYCN